MPSFAGIDLGPVATFSIGGHQVDWHQAAYAGIDGMQMNRMGHRGCAVSGHGYLTAANVAALSALVAEFHQLKKAGVVGVLDMGAKGSISGGILMEFQEAPDYELAPGYGVAVAFRLGVFFPLGF